MKGLSSCHAKKLFCLHAFQTSDAPDRFEDLVERAVESCRGLPLSLKVFGGQLCFKPREYWESQLNEIFRVLPKGILSSLRISYDALDSEEQECFLDVACFFIGEMKSLALQLWDGLGRRKGVYSWETLQNKCLVEVDEENRIRMHDHLRDLGREIANKKLPYRIWFKDQVNIIRTQAKESIQVRGIMAATVSSGIYHARCTSHYPPPFEECVEVTGSSNARDAFSLKYLVFKFKKEHFNPKIVKPSRGLVWLRCFNFKKEHFNLKIGELSRGLVWLRCFNFNHTNLSSCLSLESLRVLELYDVKRLEMIWDNDANASLQLTELIIQSPIGGLKYFQGFPPSIKRLQFLRKIAIDGNGSSMSSLPNEFCNLNSLEYLQLRSFTELSSLPISFGNLRNLRHLDLKGCSRINTLPVSFKQLTNLRYLYLYDCRNLTFNSENSSSLQNMTKLEIVVLSHCELEILPLPNPASLTNLDFAASEVRNLPDNIGQLKKLETLSMGSCHLTSLPDSSGKLCSLKELVIRGCDNLSSLPDTFGDLSSLRKFIIYGCPKLKSLPATFWGLNVLEELEIEKSGVESLPETFGALANLHKLRIHGCPKLKSLPATFGRLNALEELEMEKSGVESLPETFGALANLRKLRILFCPIRELAFGSGSRASLKKLREIKLQDTHQLSTISISEDCCPSLETLKLCNNTSLMGIETLPKTLKWLELTGCLTPKQELRFKTSPKVEILEGLKYLRSLETLKTRSEWEVPAIQSLEQMQRLKTVELSANNFAALEPCIRTIKKWPSKIQVLARVSATDGVESILNEFPFVDSFTEEAYEWRLARPHMQSSDAAIVCFVIQCDQVYTELLIRDRNWTVLFHDRLYCSDTTQADGGWVWISVCDLSTIANDYNIPKGQVFAHSSVTIKRGTLVVGQKGCVIEAFKKLLVLLKR